MWLIFSPIFSYHDVSVELGEAFPQGGDCHTLSEEKHQRHFRGKIAMLIEALLKNFQSFLEPEFHLLTIKAEGSFLRSVTDIPYKVYDT